MQKLPPICHRPETVFCGTGRRLRNLLHFNRLGIGAEEIRTPDPHNANVVLFQLSYRPTKKNRETIEETPTTGKTRFTNLSRRLGRGQHTNGVCFLFSTIVHGVLNLECRT